MSSTSSTDELCKLLDEANSCSLNVNNLFQYDNQWRCNLRSTIDTSYYSFAHGASLVEALRNAIAIARREKKLYGVKEDLSDIL